MSQSGSYIRIDNVSRRYGAFSALDGVSLDIAKEEFIAILGPSGSGKSTLLRLIAGLDRPTEGRIHFEGQDVTSLPPHKRGIGMVFQEFLLFPHRTVRENLAFPLRMRREPKEVIEERLEWVAGVLSLTKLLDRYPSQLSGGQQQRVALGRGLVARPTLLLLDEPLANLDRELRQEMEIEIRRYQKQLGIPFIYVTHNQEEALSMSDRIAVIHNGRLEALGERQSIYDHPPTPFVARFVGKSSKFRGIVSADGTTVSLQSHDFQFALPAGSAFKAGVSVDIFVKNERFDLASKAEGSAGIICTIADVVLRGPFLEYVLETDRGDTVIAVKPKRNDPLPVGEKVLLSWSPADCNVFKAED
ncbi:ABC transporter ATP-binding protein [Rhizobium sp. S95]|uniref:ABC transporter ATP-binding protein n=1 Tax=Ciceribacter sichuanensis TaxID=2949647 RepID=A0AAJ1F9X0_9HYPH|nr:MULTISPECIES: ABC transporter ATP-binding protein [unclassified Ciceribacter]MCM2395980.1 ABC transporter ATP-binding protein [Ciceribacter sp. S95]MCM2404057.1 ABC transporter ATP-binding protein [Ciceribacter sp. S153]MCO5959648.1 ABC transporter ATP-binding protein [Ciceribacter sp. S101]